VTVARDKNADIRALVHGADQYPFDPLLHPGSLEGLDRLRCIADRQYAATLYEIYVLAERNEAELKRVEEQSAEAEGKRARMRAQLWRLANKAISGALGTEARELAEYLLASDARSDRADDALPDDRRLCELASALANLGVV
jgi:hypothetical protein